MIFCLGNLFVAAGLFKKIVDEFLWNFQKG